MAQEENEEIQIQQLSSSLSSTELEAVDVKKDEENTLKFLDSLDNYLILTHSLSSTLRQGWLELASARYSMGGSRVNSGLLNLKPHSAATTVELHHDNAGSPQFSLLKWASSDDKESSLGKENIEEDEQLNEKLCSQNPVHQESSLESSKESETKTSPQENNGSESKASLHKTEKPKERAKVLSMFGTLVSPKLRASQLSFETALETLVQIANARSSILEAHDALLKDTKSTKE
ncbi:uncharacterized protein [Rutidosis leptorrhynchoides]|uniref:uncharacterized protein isoform X2 n=1 Tax=Rutidosis leptorrhynchoides TaxID=125765 RepID=UPI003A98D46F